MRKCVRKGFWVWNFDKEEKWLNEMAAKGLALVSVGFCRYEFEDCTPGEYAIRMEYCEKRPRSVEGQKYLSFIEDTGAEHVGTYGKWVYLRKKTADGGFELFSDNTSRIDHLTRIIRLVAGLTILNLVVGLFNLALLGISIFVQHQPVPLLTGNGIGFVNIILSILGFIGWARLVAKRKRLRRETQIFE